jgi:acetyl-CoA carboxylase carboxyl transferase subunit beta
LTWFRKNKAPLTNSEKRDVPNDVFDQCKGCDKILYTEKLIQSLRVCPSCNYHFRISPDKYVDLLLDDGSFEEMDANLMNEDPLKFTDLKPYGERLRSAERKVGRNSAILSGMGTIGSHRVAVALMDFRFVGGSMGSLVGEKIARAARAALDYRIPLIVVSASGGARMQEGIYSLMQLAKTSSVLARLHTEGLPYISLLTDPTTGGVTASHAMLGDINIAEPGALIGFAGPRVISDTIRQELPEDFQTSEFLLSHGMIDCVVDRRDLKYTIETLLTHMIG